MIIEENKNISTLACPPLAEGGNSAEGRQRMEKDKDNVWKEGLATIDEIDRKIEELEKLRKKKVEELRNELGECYLRNKIANIGDRYLCLL